MSKDKTITVKLTMEESIVVRAALSQQVVGLRKEIKNISRRKPPLITDRETLLKYRVIAETSAVAIRKIVQAHDDVSEKVDPSKLN